MDRKLAKHVAREAFRSGRNLEELLPLLREHCDDGEHDEYRRAIAMAIFAIQNELLKKVFAEHPTLEDEIEGDIRTYGRLL
ncbi:MAG: hypothetical protein JOY64_22990 [Alphaproteobacteria bacterium]|nr:hypothetical protein [Alphaproteobacteria bacterium]MBV8410512.1 hypothetical protein [Alphaproteobacteria bacterium]